MTFALTSADLVDLYRKTPRPAGLGVWAIDQNQLLAGAMAANLATVDDASTWPRDAMPEPAKSLMTDAQLLFILNTIEGARRSGRVWTDGDIA